jgi:adenylyltransferase/sulfurtransferase
MDFDHVEESNLQRQILFGTTSLGANKALAAKARLEDLNPTITIKAYPEKLTAQNVFTVFEPYDIIVDGTDNFNTRYLINDAAIIQNKPVVYGAIYKFEGQVSVFNYQNGPSYRCLFPTRPKEGSIANCSEVGVLGVLPGIIGTMQASEVIKILLGFESVLAGKLLCYDAKSCETTMLKIVKIPSEFKKIKARKDTFEAFYEESSCETPVREISVADALQKENVKFIDVRERDEVPKLNLTNCDLIPLGALEERMAEIPSEKNTIIFCQTGVRSKAAVTLLQKHNRRHCYSLRGGALALVNHLNINTQ